jgi:hypothetical protein
VVPGASFESNGVNEFGWIIRLPFAGKEDSPIGDHIFGKLVPRSVFKKFHALSPLTAGSDSV